MLGYTQVSWDNPGKEKQPDSANNYWAELTDQERAAAVVLGYTEEIWDKGGKKDQPASAKKYWAELTSCGEDHIPPRSDPSLVLYLWSLVSTDSGNGRVNSRADALAH